jgi:hypothetical protein
MVSGACGLLVSLRLLLRFVVEGTNLQTHSGQIRTIVVNGVANSGNDK